MSRRPARFTQSDIKEASSMEKSIRRISLMTDDELIELVRQRSNEEVVLMPDRPIPTNIIGLRMVLEASHSADCCCAVHFIEDRKILAQPLYGESGLVYFIGFGRYVKIGFTMNLKNRMDGIQTSCPEKLIFYGAYKGDRMKEERLHSKFDDYRLNGEWFHFSNDIKKYVGFTEEDAVLVRQHER